MILSWLFIPKGKNKKSIASISINQGRQEANNKK